MSSNCVQARLTPLEPTGGLAADDGCAQLIHIMTKQSSIEEPLWRSGLSIAAYCEDSESAIHNISKRHPDYEYGKTEAKANAIPGPHTCKQFESLRPEGCEGCKHKGKITSPIELGRVVLRAKGADNVIQAKSEALGETVTYHVPDYPYPYFRGKNGGVYRTVDDEDEAQDAGPEIGPSADEDVPRQG